MSSKSDSSRSQRSFVEELPEILKARRLSIRQVALKAGFDPGHLGKVLRRADYKTPSAELCERIARALDLPADYWPEYRERRVIESIRVDPKLRDEVYSRLPRRRR